MNNVLLAIIAVANAITAFFWYHNNQKMKAMATNIDTVEKATNSMKDALVASTAVAAEAKGFALGRVAGEHAADAASEKTANAVRVERNRP